MALGVRLPLRFQYFAAILCLLLACNFAWAQTNLCANLPVGSLVQVGNTLAPCPDTVANQRKPCDDAIKAFNDAALKLDASCSGAGLSANRTCLHKTAICMACTEGSGDCPNQSAYEEYIEKMEDSGTEGRYDADDLAQFAHCPDFASEQLDDLIKDKKDQKKERDDTQKEINELLEAIQKKKAEQENVEGDYKTEMERIENERQEALADLVQAAKDATEELRKQFDDINSQMDQAINQISEANLQKEEDIRAAELECYTISINQLNQFLKARTDSISQGSLSTDGLRSLLASKGKTRKQKNASFAQQRYESCLGSAPHKNRINTIKKRHGLAVGRLRQFITSKHKEQGDLVMKMGGEAMREKYKKDLDKINKKAQFETTRETRKYQGDIKKVSAELEKLNNELRLAKLRLQEMDIVYEGLVVAERAAKYSGATRAKKSSSNNTTVTGSYGLFSSTYDSAMASCGCPVDTNNPNRSSCSGLQTRAKNFGIGDSAATAPALETFREKK